MQLSCRDTYRPLETNTPNIIKQNKRFTRLKFAEAEFVSIWQKQQNNLKLVKVLNRKRVKSNFYGERDSAMALEKVLRGSHVYTSDCSLRVDQIIY